jgi:hypothetical protein
VVRVPGSADLDAIGCAAPRGETFVNQDGDALDAVDPAIQTRPRKLGHAQPWRILELDGLGNGEAFRLKAAESAQDDRPVVFVGVPASCAWTRSSRSSSSSW